MAKKFRFDPGAEKDIQEAYQWYESQEEGVGNKFLKELNEKIDTIIEKPESRFSDEEGVRRASLKKFPYFIFYLFFPPLIIVVAVWHFSRDRNAWKKRLKK